MNVAQDALGTHLEWELSGVTAVMIDWFWSNLEKAFLLWHPQEHLPLTWAVPVTPGDPVGAVHVAPQTWSDGTFRNLYIRFEDPATLASEVQALVVYDHCIVAAGLGFGPESLETDTPMGYRLHQWQASDAGVVGRSSAIAGARAETPEEGRVWAAHAAEEIGNWAVFLPRLYDLYRVVENPLYNPYADLRVERRGGVLGYRSSP
ncbi:MAG TPA: hypothetical protein VMB53_11915 [Gaiellaceae bacterium]|nr:hypothetical protein [Gaiellaceae bacterium]